MTSDAAGSPPPSLPPKHYRVPVVDPRHSGKRRGRGAEGGAEALPEGRPLTKQEHQRFLVMALSTASGEPPREFAGATRTSTTINLATDPVWEVATGAALREPVEGQDLVVKGEYAKRQKKLARKPYLPRELPLTTIAFNGVVADRWPHDLARGDGQVRGLFISLGAGGYGTYAATYDTPDPLALVRRLDSDLTLEGWKESVSTRTRLDSDDPLAEVGADPERVASATEGVTRAYDLGQSAVARRSIGAVAPASAFLWIGGEDRNGRSYVAHVSESTDGPSVTVVCDMIRPYGEGPR